MAKMFYTVAEAASKLGLDEEAIKEMAANGELQQFRDRDKLMFKREQIDELSGDSGGDASDDTVGEIPLADSVDDTGGIPLADGSSLGLADTNQASGISVFDADEIDEADPLAQTQLSSSGLDLNDDSLALESVGSGSGLLDLTQEGDDTSLGINLDEIYPSGGDDTAMGTGLGTGIGTASGASAMLDATGTAVALDASVGGGTSDFSDMEMGGVDLPTIATGDPDAAFNGFSAGALLGVTAVLIAALSIVSAGIVGTTNSITDMIADNVMMNSGILLAVCIVLGVIGMFIGKMSSK